MADGITVEVFGNKAILDGITNWGTGVAQEAQKLLEQAGQVGLEYSDSLTPVRTGYLLSRNQLDVQPGVVTISNDADYAIFIVLGHFTRGHKSFVPPNDFLTPGMQAGGAWLQEQLGAL